MLAAQLRKEGYAISDYRTRKLMKQLGLVVKQRKPYRVSSKGKATADNLLNQNFNPVAVNEIWAGDITYCVPGVQGEHGCSNEPRVCLEY